MRNKFTEGQTRKFIVSATRLVVPSVLPTRAEIRWAVSAVSSLSTPSLMKSSVRSCTRILVAVLDCYGRLMRRVRSWEPHVDRKRVSGPPYGGVPSHCEGASLSAACRKSLLILQHQ